jgi:probable F420-dependent oxidoreductase
MRVGAYIFATASSISPIELGDALEAHGYESLFLPEHTHIPTSRKTPFRFGGELPRYYAETYDPFVALAAVAAKTERLVLGFGICLLIERDAIVVAKAVASLDVLSNGRVVVGVGAGWNQDEIENHGVDFRTRWKLLREQVEAMKAIWSEDEAEYHGDLVNVERMWSWPKPLQKPHPPVLLGSNGPRTCERVLRYADGWIPNRSLSPAEIVLRIAELKAVADERGVPHPPVTVFGAPPDDDSALERYAEAGVERILLALPTAPAAEVRPLVERYARLVERYR